MASVALLLAGCQQQSQPSDEAPSMNESPSEQDDQDDEEGDDFGCA